MDGRYWVWLGVRLLIGVVIVGWAASYLRTGGGEKEFQRAAEALRQVHSVRIASTVEQSGTQRAETLWEVSCGQQAYHFTSRLVDTASGTPSDIHDEMHVGVYQYEHQSDDSWVASKRWNSRSTPSNLCARITQGSDNGPMPPLVTMIRRGILQEGDKKTVGGVPCREWNVTLKGGPAGLEHDTICLGLDDHLPYEFGVNWQHSRTLYSDYNSPVPMVLPEATVRSTSAATN